MNIFQIKTKPHGTDREAEFIHDKFIAIGWPGIGDLTGVGRAEIKERLKNNYPYDGQKLGYCLGVVNAFVNTMEERDIVLMSSTRNDHVHIGVVGPYRYEENYDNKKDGMCHQRSVEWTKFIPRRDLNDKVQELLRNRGTLTQFKYPVEMAELDSFDETGSFQTEVDVPTVPEEIIQKALRVLEEELDSTDPDRRLAAAVELLRFSK
ncbi:hypothetical protein [Evansella tamaricis]|uniref:Uncharacterized protein n=1 Tax=Evansella tamaricis TaxID=2069301 RepID=A0ABS6JHY0_9BACI|nr:hypothetical protein [Evansella tamaricis]MBU9713201.1 hypothetical protein [Evansella tamaricis]